MTWTTDVPHKGDTVYFSHCFPYTYTDLQDYLLDLSNDPVKSKICKQRVLCRTLAGNLVYVLTITSPSQNPEDIKVSNQYCKLTILAYAKKAQISCGVTRQLISAFVFAT